MIYITNIQTYFIRIIILDLILKFLTFIVINYNYFKNIIMINNKNKYLIISLLFIKKILTFN